MNIVSLLQQGVPGHPDIGQFRNLFTPQSRSTTTAARGQTHICGVKACARKRRGLVGVLAHPSLRFIIDPRENPATTRQIVQGFIAAGATHLVLAPRTLNEGIAHWMSKE